MRLIAHISVIVFAVATLARAQPLVDHVPDDAIVYFGWAGTKDLGTDYQQSHLKAILEVSEFDSLLEDFLPRVVQKLGAQQPQTAEIADTVVTLVDSLIKHPTALYFGGIEMDVDGEPTIKLALLCQAGDDAPAVVERINAILDQIPPNPLDLVASAQPGGLITLRPRRFSPPETSLASSKVFTSALGQVSKSPVVVAYIDVEKLEALAELILEHQNPGALTKWQNVYSAMGFIGLKRVIWSAEFAGQNWSSQLFVEAPSPRTGLLTALNTRPMSDDLLKAVPKSATMLMAGTFDAGKSLHEFRASLAQIDPETAKQFGQAIGVVTATVGKRVEEDILGPLGDQWAVYASPEVAGTGLTGIIVVNKLDDPAKASASFKALSIALNNVAKGMLRGRDFELSGRSVKINGVDVYYAALPYVAPSWAIQDGYLYLAFYPQGAAAAARYVSKGRDSILQNEAYAEMRTQLGVSNASGVSFLDLPKLAGTANGYPMLLVLARAGLGFADVFGIPAPEPLIPPLDVLLEHLSPAGSVSWSDDLGLHVRSLSPFPGAIVLSDSGAAMLTTAPITAMSASILLPSLNRARETANRVKCASNMRVIGQAILLYANENQGNYPDDLGTLVTTQDISAVVFVCPSSNVDAPRNLNTPQAQAQWVNENSVYVYLGKGLTTAVDAETVVLYEQPDDHDNDGVNILFGDGHVEFMVMPSAQRRIPQLNEGF